MGTMRYRVQWDYRSSLTGKIGPLVKGAVIDLPDELAAHINRDSAGVLVPAEPLVSAPVEPENRAAPAAPVFTPNPPRRGRPPRER